MLRIVQLCRLKSIGLKCSLSTVAAASSSKSDTNGTTNAGTVTGRPPSMNRRKERLKERSERYIAKFAEDPNRPFLQSLLRAFYMKAHPDVIRHSKPDLADVNTTSIQVLNGVLSTLKVANDYPPRICQSIPFHVKVGELIVLHHLELETAGGDSKRQLTDSFTKFFKSVGILETKSFVWDKEYFPEVRQTVD